MLATLDNIIMIIACPGVSYVVPGSDELKFILSKAVSQQLQLLTITSSVSKVVNETVIKTLLWTMLEKDAAE
jgi:hypothetical protein